MELLRDRSDELRALGVQPYGISRDSPWTHVAWTQALDLNFPLLSDFNGDATHGFDIAYEHRGLREVSARSAFLIDRDGTICAAWRYEPAELPDLDEIANTAKEVLPPSG
jgi:peroxiredoxin (alkyl hydroperoxide reductase subunit C)